MKKIGLRQGLQGIMALATSIDWRDVDADIFQASVIDKTKEAGKQFTLFLMNQARVNIEKAGIVQLLPEFDMEEFSGLDEGESFGEFVMDSRGAAFIEVDVSKILFQPPILDLNIIHERDSNINHPLDLKHVRLDSRVFKACWDNRHRLPESWKIRTDEGRRSASILFEGTSLLYDSCRYVLALYWDFEESRWIDTTEQVAGWKPALSGVSAVTPLQFKRK